jgi:hypothetical protein
MTKSKLKTESAKISSSLMKDIKRIKKQLMLWKK